MIHKVVKLPIMSSYDNSMRASSKGNDLEIFKYTYYHARGLTYCEKVGFITIYLIILSTT